MNTWNITKKMENIINKELDNIMLLDAGTAEFRNAVDDVAKICKLRGDEIRLLNEIADSYYKNKQASDAALEKKTFREEQSKNEKIDRRISLGIAAANLILPLGVYTGLALLGFVREFDGIITSDTLKRLLNGMKFIK